MLAMVSAPDIGWVILGGLAMYFLGGIPFGYLLGRMKGIDVRKAGSGNIGATNVGRLCGWPYGVAALLLDAAKGFLPCLLLAPALGERLITSVPHAAVVMQTAFGIGAIVGHMWPVYLGFKGGKGVATAAGVFLALAPWALLCAFIAWTTFTALTKYVSIGSIASVIGLACGQLLCYPSEAWTDRLGVTLFTMGVMLIVIIKHRGNISRLIKGKEPRLSLGKKRAAPEVAGKIDGA